MRIGREDPFAVLTRRSRPRSTIRRAATVAIVAASLALAVAAFGQEAPGSGTAATDVGEGSGQSLDCDESVLPSIYFDFDDAAIPAEQVPQMEHIAACMVAYPERRIRIEAHTDARGTSEFNFGVSQRQANTAQRYLERQGIDAARIEAVGLGEEQPLCTEQNEACWRRNRRTEFHWIESIGDDDPDFKGVVPQFKGDTGPAD